MPEALFLQSSQQALGTPRQNVTDGVPHVRGEIPTVFQPSAGPKGLYHMMWGEPRADGSCALLQAQPPAALFASASFQAASCWDFHAVWLPVRGRIVPQHTLALLTKRAPEPCVLLGDEQGFPQAELLLPEIKYRSKRRNDVWTSFCTVRNGGSTFV